VLEGDTKHPAGDDSVLPEDDVGHEGTLADEDAFDALDQMIRDVEPENLDDRKLKKLEQMRKDAKTPLYSGASVSKLEADLMLMQLKSNNGGMLDKGSMSC